MTLSAPVRPLRRDAAENRQRILDAASEVFARHGVEAGVDEIARTAGVGMGTLYRRFPTKQALIDELVGGLRRELVELAVAAERQADGRGLEWLLTRVGELQADRSGCLDRLWNQSDAELAALERFRTMIVELLEQAQQAARLRPDLTATDVTMVLWSLRGIIQTTRDDAPNAWRRHLDLLLAGMRTGTGKPLAHPPITAAQSRKISARR
jgi:AcrR family transcriptional regulator